MSMTLSRYAARIGTAMLVVVGCLVTGARAQVAPVEPYWAVVSSDAVMRSGDRDLYYPVARLSAGQLVRVDGEGGGWSRVEYPRGLTAFIAADAVTVDPSGKTVTLTRPEKVRAAREGVTKAVGSWRHLGETPLPAGTALTLAHPATLEDTGGKSAYRVAAPESARGFVQSGALQRATQQQIDAFLAALNPAPAGETPKPATTEIAAAVPTTTEAATPAPEAAPSAPREPSLIERLEAAFDAVQKQPTETAELSELIAEYQKALADLPESPLTDRTRARMQRRIDLLSARADLQTQLLAIAEARPRIDEATQRAAAALADLERVRQYTVVGRLSTSTIYDGQRLPMLLRIQSVGSPLPRTLAYIRPGPLRLENKVGQLVGVIGESSMDPDLKLKIITPTRVDALQAIEPKPERPIVEEAPPVPAAPPA